MRLGVVFPHHDLSGDPVAIRAHAQAAEAAGYDHYVAYDHVVGALRDRPGGFTGPYDHETGFTDPFVLFSHLAAVTSFMELVTGIIILPQRQTALVAKQAADVQVLSQGRLRLEGSFDRVPLAGIKPRPSRRIPIWMGGTVDRVLDRVGRLADGWFPQLRDPNDLAAPLARIHHAAEESGRNKGDVGVNPTIRLSGDVRRDVDLALRWREAGATHLSVSTLNRGHLTPADHIEEIEVFKDGWDDAR